MKLHRLILLTMTLLVVGAPVMAQGDGMTDRSRNSQLESLAGKLAQQADDLSEQVYRDYSNGSNNRRAETDGVFLSQQFSASADIFRRMVQDRRRTSELRDAGSLLSSLASRGNSYSSRSRWSDVQRTVADIQRELNYGNGGGNGGGGNGGGGNGGGNSSGLFRWSGTVDDEVQLKIQGDFIEASAISGTPYNDTTFSFTTPLPQRQVNVRVRKLRGRGDVRVLQQPSRFNDWTAIVSIRDGDRSADRYELEINW
ncbi:MAG: hypothetical protein ABIP75_10155 [Pyrinomonadaceae bacterium]